MKSVLGLIQTTRLVKSIIVGLLLMLISDSLFYGVSVALFLSFSFSFNDFVDASKDKLGHPNRAIPSGKITRLQSFYFSLFLLIIGVIWFTLFLKEYIFGFITAYFFSILYSFFLKPNIPVLATPVWSVAIAILFLQYFTQNIVAYIGVASIVYGYELILDYRDRKADEEFCKTPTLVNMLGKYSHTVTILFFFVGAVLLIKAF